MKKVFAATALAAVFLSHTAEADIGFNAIGDMFTYNGFGTAGVARSDTDGGEFVQEFQNLGAGKNFDWKTDSKLGLQGTFAPTTWLSGTIQGLSEERFFNHISTQIEWAYIKISPLNGLSFRGGKMALPAFLVSDSRNVGYANNWVRAPDEVYGPNQFDTFQGFDVAYRHAIGKYSVTVGALAGQTTPSDFMVYPGVVGVILGHELRGYNASVDLDLATIRVSRVTSAVAVLIDNAIIAKGLVYTFTSIGATYDHNNVVGQAEFIEKRTDGSIAYSFNGWYALGGYRLGKWLPYAIYASGERPGGAGGTVPELTRHTESVGVRLDWFKSVDFKAQLDHITGFGGGFPNNTPFVNVQPGFNNKANVLTLTADFVF
ncbi:MAG: hypothetical protein QOI88_4380 [Gammaproteobacteria bacterium]|jgi:hypothetical protein|nr:hypothetical protein [Gammaproteobacteria bacterium]